MALTPEKIAEGKKWLEDRGFVLLTNSAGRMAWRHPESGIEVQYTHADLPPRWLSYIGSIPGEGFTAPAAVRAAMERLQRVIAVPVAGIAAAQALLDKGMNEDAAEQL